MVNKLFELKNKGLDGYIFKNTTEEFKGFYNVVIRDTDAQEIVAIRIFEYFHEAKDFIMDFIFDSVGEKHNG